MLENAFMVMATRSETYATIALRMQITIRRIVMQMDLEIYATTARSIAIQIKMILIMMDLEMPVIWMMIMTV